MTSNFEGFQEIKKLADSKGYSSHVIWNPEICQDSPTCGQDDLVLSPEVVVYYRNLKRKEANPLGQPISFLFKERFC